MPTVAGNITCAATPQSAVQMRQVLQHQRRKVCAVGEAMKRAIQPGSGVTQQLDALHAELDAIVVSLPGVLARHEIANDRSRKPWIGVPDRVV